ncbi:MAG: hypothetical protein IIV23_08395 [Ruminococcus sp.]|nr:hypothetical protein [Ruminococcus sp.]
MTEAIVVAILSLVGTFAGSFSGMKLISYRIEQLEKRVEEHNSVIKRTFILEEQMKEVTRRIDVIESDK